MTPFASLDLLLLWLFMLTFTGAAFLRLMGLATSTRTAFFVLSYWVGFVLYGFYLFFPALLQHLSPSAALLPLVPSSLFALWLAWERRPHPSQMPDPEPAAALPAQHLWRRVQPWLAGGIFFCVALLALPQALMPPINMGALGWQSTLPHLFAAHRGLVFFPVAVDFATPHLSQLLNTGAFLIGGDRLVSLHVWSAAVMAALAAFVLARYWVKPALAWLFALTVYTVPAFSSAAASGSAEPVLLGLLALSALALIHYRREQSVAWLVLSALLAGACASTSYSGLFTLPALGAGWLLLVKNYKLKFVAQHAAVWVGVLLLIGSPWYVWNAYHTGNPFFPFLHGVFGGFSAAQMDVFQRFWVASVQMVDRTWLHLLSYPWNITAHSETFGGVLSDMGPFFLISLAPAVLLLVSRFPRTRDEDAHGLDVYTLMALVFYVLWFMLGVAGHPQHLLPILPLLMLSVLVWGMQVVAMASALPRLVLKSLFFLMIAVDVSLVVMQALPAASAFASTLQASDPRTKATVADHYLRTQAPPYAVAEWLNAELVPLSQKGQNVRLLVSAADISPFYLKVPALNGHPLFQETVPVARGSSMDILNALWQQNITHWLTEGNPLNAADTTPVNGHAAMRELVDLGCLKPISSMDMPENMAGAATSLSLLPSSKASALLPAPHKMRYSLYEIRPLCAPVAAQ